MLCWQACTTRTSSEQTGSTGGIVRYARHFQLEEHGRAFRLSLSDGRVFWLTHTNDSAVQEGVVVQIPVRTILCTSTTQLPLFTGIGAGSAVIAFPNTKYIYDSSLRAGVVRGVIRDVAGDAGLNEEAVVGINPDVLLVDRGLRLTDRLTRRFPVISTLESHEADPLGRAEWMLLAGALTGRLKEADSVFRAVEQRYLSIRNQVSKGRDPNSVLYGIPYGGTWYLPGSSSFMFRLLTDAGYQCAWPSRMDEVVVPLGLEAVMKHSMQAAYWIGAGSIQSMEELGALDRRFTGVQAFRSGSVFTYNARTTPSGGNDYFESAVVRPDLLLADLIRIRQGSGEGLYYFRRLPR